MDRSGRSRWTVFRINLYIAFEMLAKVDKNDTLYPKMALMLGIFQGRYATEGRAVAATAICTNASHFVTQRLDSMRDQRNRIVHAGFRRIPLDATERAEFLSYVEILSCATESLLVFARQGVEQKIPTVIELWGKWVDVLNGMRACGNAPDWEHSWHRVRDVHDLAVHGIEFSHLSF